MGLQAADTLKTDSTKVVEVAALDIAEDRGLFILTPDKKMQMRILGSVRYLIVFDQKNLSSKDAYSTYEIPTGDLNTSLPNYFNGLGQSRLGFEVVRITNKGDIFIRLETDFAGSNGFRIRHAYRSGIQSPMYLKALIYPLGWSILSPISRCPIPLGQRFFSSYLQLLSDWIRFIPGDHFRSRELSLRFPVGIVGINLYSNRDGAFLLPW